MAHCGLTDRQIIHEKLKEYATLKENLRTPKLVHDEPLRNLLIEIITMVEVVASEFVPYAGDEETMLEEGSTLNELSNFEVVLGLFMTVIEMEQKNLDPKEALKKWLPTYIRVLLVHYTQAQDSLKELKARKGPSANPI